MGRSTKRRGVAIPGDHTIEMERGVTIGGIVKSRDGKPVAGATVSVRARAGADASPDWTYVPDVKVTTDTAGHWQFSEMPTGWSYVYCQRHASRLRPDVHATRCPQAE